MFEKSTMIPTVTFYQRLGSRISLWLTAFVIPAVLFTAFKISDFETAKIEELVLEKGKTVALTGAQSYARILEAGIASGELKLADLLDPKYEEIKYPHITPPLKLDYKRYHTQFDTYTDSHGIQELQDAILNSSPDYIFASGMDHLGYVPTPHKAYSDDPVGDPKIDGAKSRKKRKYEGATFAAAAGFLGDDNNPVLVQLYNRTPGGRTWDIAAPISVQGKHFGAFRVGVRFDRIDEHQSRFKKQLIFWFGVFGIAMIAITWFLLWLKMRPLEHLTKLATLYSTSEDAGGLAQPITTVRDDEIGGMARALNRLRVSLKAAMERIPGAPDDFDR